MSDAPNEGCPKCGTVDTGRFLSGALVCTDCVGELEPGDTVELTEPLDDPYTLLRPGDKGIVTRLSWMADELVQVAVSWDSGSKLALVPEDLSKVRWTARSSPDSPIGRRP